MKKYPCIPGAAFLSWFFSFAVLIYLVSAYWAVMDGQVDAAYCIVVFAAVTLSFLIWQWKRTVWNVLIFEHGVVCRALFCRPIFISFDDCRVGFGYHIQGSGKVWWIYLCDSRSRFDTRFLCNKINTLKCEDGFIRIIYRQDLFAELMDRLPRQHRETLLSEKRFYRID